MKKEYIIAAKTVEEAITDARIKYGSEGELSFEVLEMPKKGFLGIGSSPAKIKVTVEEEEEDLMAIFGSSKKEARKPEPKKEEKRETAKKAEKENKGNDRNRANGDRNPKNNEKNREKANKQANKPAPEKKEEKPVQTPRREEVEAPSVKEEAPAPVKRLSDEDIRVSREEMEVALAFVSNLLSDMEIDAVAVANLEPDADGNVSRVIDIQGTGAGKLIGHHGETLDSIQYLANLALNRKHGSRRHEYVKVVVDIEGYRAKREDTLRQFARRMADKALKYKRNVLLEPMNPYERRIIHSEIQGIEGVSTHSVGSDENRKIVITYDAGPKSGNGGRRNNQHRRRGKKDVSKETAEAPAIPTASDSSEGEEVLREY